MNQEKEIFFTNLPFAELLLRFANQVEEFYAPLPQRVPTYTYIEGGMRVLNKEEQDKYKEFIKNFKFVSPLALGIGTLRINTAEKVMQAQEKGEDKLGYTVTAFKGIWNLVKQVQDMQDLTPFAIPFQKISQSSLARKKAEVVLATKEEQEKFLEWSEGFAFLTPLHHTCITILRTLGGMEQKALEAGFEFSLEDEPIEPQIKEGE